MVLKPVRAGATLLLACSLTLLCACAPKFVGEAQAKKAGLALFQQAFGVVARDAHVEYFERAGSSVIDNSEVEPGDGTPDQIYLVTISDQSLGTDLYYAEVDAKTGVAYYASKSGWLLAPLSEDQKQQSSEINNLNNNTDATAATQNDNAEYFACDYLVHHFKKEVALIRSQDCCRRDNILSPRVGIGYFVTFADGALYRVGFSWPSMELNYVQSLGNELEDANP
jgi:hypothetical protein